MTAQEMVRTASERLDADIAAYFGGLSLLHDERLLKQCRERRRRKNVILALQTYGGDPSAAYRIARCFQQAYVPAAAQPHERGTFSVLVFGLCKSAGTLLCVGANRIYATDDVDFGPIDVQLRKPDEVGERTSGLTPLQALDVLQIRSLGLFKAHFRQLRFDEDLVS